MGSNWICPRPIGSDVEVFPEILTDAGLPDSLMDLPRPPRRLYLNGTIPKIPMIAIVGTRHPTPEAEDFARSLAQQVAEHGFGVSSGGAAGIDTAAHEGALAAAGQTLVVAPAGWDESYPEANRELFRKIVARGGGYLSVVAPDQRALMHNFFARNAVLVALSKATVVVQAPVRSGARNSAHVARRIGRMLFAVPSAPWVDRGAGCILELRLGARPLGCLGDLLAGLSELGVHGSRDPLQLELPLGSPSVRKVRSCPQRDSIPVTSPLEWVEAFADLLPVIEALADGCSTLDSVCIRSGWNTPKVQSALLRLTLGGCIRMTSAGRIEIVTQ